MSYIEQWEDEHYKRLMRDEPLELVRTFFEAIKADNKERMPLSVLDVGCSAGSNSLWLAHQGFRVHAFDGSGSAINRMLDAAIQQNVLRNYASVMIADMSKPWPYQDDKFNVVLDVRALENLNAEEVTTAYKHAARVLVRGGIFFSLTASEDRPHHYTTCGTVRPMTEKDIKIAMSAVGLECVSIARAHKGTLEDWCLVARKP